MIIKSKKLKDLLKKKGETHEKGLPHFDNIQKIVTKVIEESMPRVATCPEMWKYMKPYVDTEIYKKANGELAEEYRQLQKCDYEMGRLKEKIKTEIDKENIILEEFEELGSVEIKDGKVTIEKVDQIEEYKKLLREKKK